MKQHAGLTAERWRTFDSERQLLMIANEMNRVTSSLDPEHDRSRRLGYERVLALTDLTIGVTERRGLRKELLRWRDLVARLFSTAADPHGHRSALRAFMSLSRATWDQLRALEAVAARRG